MLRLLQTTEQRNVFYPKISTYSKTALIKSIWKTFYSVLRLLGVSIWIKARFYSENFPCLLWSFQQWSINQIDSNIYSYVKSSTVRSGLIYLYSSAPLSQLVSLPILNIALVLLLILHWYLTDFTRNILATCPSGSSLHPCLPSEPPQTQLGQLLWGHGTRLHTPGTSLPRSSKQRFNIPNDFRSFFQSL